LSQSVILLFFSSRRRHTRFSRDWSSDVCSSDLRVKQVVADWSWLEVAGGPPDAMGDISKNIPDDAILKPQDYFLKFEVNTLKPRSEERRVGKEWGTRWKVSLL